MFESGKRCAIVGVGDTECVKYSERDGNILGLEAIQKALNDAGMDSREIDGVIVEQGLGAKHLPFDELSSNLGISRFYSGTIGLAGAGTAGSVLAAAMAIECGLANNVLVYYISQFGRMARSAYKYHEDEWPVKLSFELPYGFYAQASYYAAMANRYMHECGLTPEQLSSMLGSIAVTTRRHGILNGKAQQKKPLSYEDYLLNPIIADPLHAADCCLNTDGAAAVVVTGAQRSKDCPHPPAYLMGGGFACMPMSGSAAWTQGPDYPWMQNHSLATEQAFKRAGITHQDIDFAQIYDCFTITVALELEDLGFCGRGEAGAFVADGNIGLEGSLPINTDGGNLSHGYLVGMGHVVEAVRQLRGEAGRTQVQNAKIGFVGGAGGHEYCSLILGKL